MATTYAHPGDTIIIDNVEHTLTSVGPDDVIDTREELSYAIPFVLRKVDRICAACEMNPPCDDLPFCETCIERAMFGAAIASGVAHILEGDERIDAVMAWDRTNAHDARVKAQQYISVSDSAHDEISAMNDDDLRARIIEWVPSIMAGMRHV